MVAVPAVAQVKRPRAAAAGARNHRIKSFLTELSFLTVSARFPPVN